MAGRRYDCGLNRMRKNSGGDVTWGISVQNLQRAPEEPVQRMEVVVALMSCCVMVFSLRPLLPGNRCSGKSIYCRLKVLGTWTWIISLGVALSTFGSANGTFFSGGRVCYVAAREGHLPDALSMAHVTRLTLSPALIFTSAISLIMIIPGDFSSIVNFFSFTAWLFYGITISGLIYMKIKKPDIPRPYKVPIIIPVIVLIAAIYLVLAPIIGSPQLEYLYVTLFILSGIILYVPIVHYKWSPGWFRSVTLHLQLLLQVAPADKND